MVKLRGRIAASVTILLAASGLVAFGAFADPVLDRVVVVGQRIGGGALTCMSGPCFDTANAQAAEALREYQAMYQAFPQDELPWMPGSSAGRSARSSPQGAVSVVRRRHRESRCLASPVFSPTPVGQVG